MRPRASNNVIKHAPHAPPRVNQRNKARSACAPTRQTIPALRKKTLLSERRHQVGDLMFMPKPQTSVWGNSCHSAVASERRHQVGDLMIMPKPQTSVWDNSSHSAVATERSNQVGDLMFMPNPRLQSGVTQAIVQ